MRILLVGESAAGHLSPIIAIYDEIKKMESQLSEEVDFRLISSDSHFLKDMFEDTGISYKVINSPKTGQPLSFLKFLASFFSVISYIFNYMPDIIFSKGGYVSLPVVLIGKIFKIPIIMHESDSIPSSVDKFMSHFAVKVAVSFEQSKEFYDSKKVFFTGNPIREFIMEGDKERGLNDFVLTEDKPVVFIMGGSEGAEKINELVIEILSDLLNKYQIIHQCGIGDYDKVKAAVEKMNVPNLNDYHIFPFFKKRIADAYAVCDLIISRAGANTVSEIMAVGKPSILIPLSEAVSDRQKRNAFYYSEAGAAVLVSEKNLKPHLLLNIINEIFDNSLKTIEIKRAAIKMARVDAAKKVANAIVDLAK